MVLTVDYVWNHRKLVQFADNFNAEPPDFRGYNSRFRRVHQGLLALPQQPESEVSDHHLPSGVCVQPATHDEDFQWTIRIFTRS